MYVISELLLHLPGVTTHCHLTMTSLKGQRGQTMVNIKFVRDFDVKSISYNVTKWYWGVMAFTIQDELFFGKSQKKSEYLEIFWNFQKISKFTECFILNKVWNISNNFEKLRKFHTFRNNPLPPHILCENGISWFTSSYTVDVS